MCSMLCRCRNGASAALTFLHFDASFNVKRQGAGRRVAVAEGDLALAGQPRRTNLRASKHRLMF